MIINCETFESSLESIANFFNTSKDEVCQFLFEFDMDEYYERHSYNNTGEYLLFEMFCEKYRNVLPLITETHWFHLTRIPLNEEFNGAIKPLGDRLEERGR